MEAGNRRKMASTKMKAAMAASGVASKNQRRGSRRVIAARAHRWTKHVKAEMVKWRGENNGK
jgi:hypothetical protein